MEASLDLVAEPSSAHFLHLRKSMTAEGTAPKTAPSSFGDFHLPMS
jgi:hypothetical protein